MLTPLKDAKMNSTINNRTVNMEVAWMQDNKKDSRETIDTNTEDNILGKDSQELADEMNLEMMEGEHFEQESEDVSKEYISNSKENNSERTSSSHSNGKSKKRKQKHQSKRKPKEDSQSKEKDRFKDSDEKESRNRKQEQHTEKRNIIPVILSIIIMTVIAGGGYIFWNQYMNEKQLDFLSLRTISLTGSNGAGHYVDNREAMIFDGPDPVKEVLKAVKVEITPNENLKNGDVVSIKIAPDDSQIEILKEHRYNLKLGSQTLTVTGLTDDNTIDFFENVSVSYITEGDLIAVNTTIDPIFDNVDDTQNTILKQIKVKPIETKKYRNGDTLLLELDIPNQTRKALQQQDVTLLSETKTITIQGLVETPRTIGDIDTLDTMKQQAQLGIESDYKKGQEDARNFKVVNTCYTDTITTNENFENYSNGSLVFIFEFEQDAEAGPIKKYTSYHFTNITSLNGKVQQDSVVVKGTQATQEKKESVVDPLRNVGFSCK